MKNLMREKTKRKTSTKNQNDQKFSEKLLWLKIHFSSFHYIREYREKKLFKSKTHSKIFVVFIFSKKSSKMKIFCRFFGVWSFCSNDKVPISRGFFEMRKFLSLFRLSFGEFRDVVKSGFDELETECWENFH
jgi:hypothetical protein